MVRSGHVYLLALTRTRRAESWARMLVRLERTLPADGILPLTTPDLADRCAGLQGGISGRTGLHHHASRLQGLA
jgi:hypothetical protein